MKRRTTTLLVTAFIGAVMVACLSASAQLVYVKCCFKRTNVYRFGPALTGPIRWSLPGWDGRISGSCIYGFGPDIKSIALQAEMCGSYILPDQSDSHCTWWWADDINIVDLCSGCGSWGNLTYIVYDYDGDGDLDLRDFAYFQNHFEREIQGW